MSNYDIKITRKLKKDKKGKVLTEIWADITDNKTCDNIKKRIWWADEKGIFHDETKLLPVNLRDAVDNAWIEKSRKF